MHPLQVQGPLSARTLAKLVGDAIYDIPYYWCRHFEIHDIPVLISRTGWSAVPGFEVSLLDGSRGAELWDAITDAGEEFAIRPIAPNEARRVEAGIFNWGSDITLGDTPFHVMGLERLVEEQPQDYIGKAALERIRREGVDRKLVGIAFDNAEPLPGITCAWPAYQGGTLVGRVTDAVWSPGLGRNVGYVWVPIDLAAPGTRLDGGLRPRHADRGDRVDPVRRPPQGAPGGRAAESRSIRSSAIQAAGAANSSASMRSSTPPWPPSSVPESFTPRSRFRNDSKRSPNGAASATTTPSTAACACGRDPSMRVQHPPDGERAEDDADHEALDGLLRRDRRRQAVPAEQRARRSRRRCRDAQVPSTTANSMSTPKSSGRRSRSSTSDASPKPIQTGAEQRDGDRHRRRLAHRRPPPPAGTSASSVQRQREQHPLDAAQCAPTITTSVPSWPAITIGRCGRAMR